jgi:hypothetical protein
LKKNLLLEISKKIFIPLLTVAFILINTQILKARDKKDLILIIDTSLTMAGYGQGSSNILPQVKKSLPQFIDQLDSDDSITLITFDTDIKMYPTIYIDDKKNKESLVEYIKNIKANGAWTYTSQMMRTAFQKASELEAKDKDRQRVIVIMTDTLDDPPPGKLNDRLNVKNIAKNYKDKDWFIFFMNFGEAIKNNAKLAQMQKDLKTNVSKYTNVIEVPAATGAAGNKLGKDGKPVKDAKDAAKIGEKGIKTTIEKDLSENIKKMTDKKDEIDNQGTFPIKTLILVLLIIAILLAALYYFKTYAGLKVTGSLEYWDHTMISPYYENFNLTKQDAREIFVGPKNTFHLTIRDIEISDPFKIFAIRVDREVKSTLQAGKGYIIEYVNREPDGYLKNGDMFKVANFTFKYKSA